MDTTSERESRIRAKREAAEKARRMALALERPEDRQRLRTFADELDAQADELEREQPSPAGPPPPEVTQTQVQVQNQQATPGTPDEPEEPKEK